MVIIKFQVSANEKQLDKREHIFLVGDSDKLGNWKQNDAIRLKLNGDIWKTEVDLPANEKIKYRYFIGSEHKESLLITLWEVHPYSTTRCISVTDGSDMQVTDEFGFVNGVKSTDKGWLTTQTEIRVGIACSKGNPFVKFSQGYLSNNSDVDTEKLKVKLTAFGDVLTTNCTIIKPFTFQEISVIPETGLKIPEDENTFIQFTVQTYSNPGTSTTTKLEIFSDSTRIGTAIIGLGALSASKKILRLPLLSEDFLCIGILQVNYLRIDPLQDEALNLKTSYSKHWKSRPMVHVGHRGCGNSYTSKFIAIVPENTVTSFQTAGENGAKLVEFDVHLTKELVPIVYHDLTTSISVERKDSTKSLLEIPVFKLSLEELQVFSVRHKSRISNTRKLGHNEDDISHDNQLFPTLKTVLTKVLMSTGFDIEVKWPTLDVNHHFEDGLEHYIDANVFVDEILKVVYKFGGERRIVFSSFDVDICILLKRKQGKYPVFFLTNGDTGFYTPLLDTRERTNAMAAGTSLREQFIGIVTLDQDVYKTPDIVKKIKSTGLLFACYGDNVTDNLPLMKSLNVDIVIYDRISKNLTQTSV